MKYNRLITWIIIASTLGLMLAGCGKNSDKEKAEAVVKTFLTALEQNDMTTLYSCYDPDVQSVSAGITEMGMNFLGIGGASQETALGMYGLMNQAAAGWYGGQWEFEKIELTDCKLSKNSGTMKAELGLKVTYQGYEITVPGEIDFVLVKKKDEWYVGAQTGELVIDEEELKKQLQDLGEKEGAESAATEETETEQEEEILKMVVGASAFSNGIAVLDLADAVESVYGYQNWAIAVIDNRGNILNVLEGYQRESDFEYGLFWAKDETGNRVLINPDGKVLVNGEGIPVDADPEMEWRVITFENGYPVVTSHTESFYGIADWIGFINTDGNWLQEPFIFKDTFQTSEDFVHNDITCLGEGIYVLRDSRNGEYYIYNAEENRVLESDEEFYWGGIRFMDGYATIRKDGVAYLIDREFHCQVLWDQNVNVVKEYNKELIYLEFFDEEKGDWQCGFVTPQGELKFLLPELEDTSYETIYPYENGRAVVTLRREGGTGFAVMDTEGNFVFEPIEGGVKDVSEGCFVTDAAQVYTYDGELLFERPGIYTSFHDGCALVNDGNKYHVDKNGNPLYDSMAIDIRENGSSGEILK